MSRICREAWVSGRVQGVGFRAFVRSKAREHGVTGWANNLGDGRVHVRLCGEPLAVAAVEHCLQQGPRWSSVEAVEVQPVACRLIDDFRIG